MNEDTFDVIPDDPDVDDPERELTAAGGQGTIRCCSEPQTAG
jgi:hypothetical protein